MTKDRARKQSVRARMAAKGEPYSVAARKLADESDSGDAPARSLLVDRVNATLAARSARMGYHFEIDFGIGGGLRAELIKSIGRAVKKRIAPDMPPIGDLMSGEGFVEPSANRYQICLGELSAVFSGGQQFVGGAGKPVEEHNRAPQNHSYLALLDSLRSANSAEFLGEDVVRDTPCRVLSIETEPDEGDVERHEFTVWVDDAHVRRIRDELVRSGLWGRTRSRTTLELWDFGVPTDMLDWSRFPDS